VLPAEFVLVRPESIRPEKFENATIEPFDFARDMLSMVQAAKKRGPLSMKDQLITS
jgi:hypothetical protein